MSTAAQLYPAALGAALALPAVLAAAWAVGAWRRHIGAWLPWAPLPALAAALLLPDFAVELPWLVLGVRLEIAPLNRALLAASAFVWCIGGLLARRGAPRFQLYFLLAMFGNLGAIAAGDMVGFYCFFALMSFSSYGLIVWRDEQAVRRAGRVYMVLVVLGEVALFAALVLMAQTGAGTSFAGLAAGVAAAPARDAIILLLLIAFGVKCGLLPLHVSLPLVYAAAPTPAAVVLAGAMINAGLLGWLRLLPLGELASPAWGSALIGAGAAGALLGVLAGLLQRHPRTILAYSSISQMGLMLLPLGVALHAPQLWPVASGAVVLYAVHHALAKAALFLAADAVARAGARRRWAFAAACLPAGALAGLPLTSGAVAKTAMKTLVQGLDPAWTDALLVILALGALATTLLMARLLVVLWRGTAAAPEREGAQHAAWRLMLLAVALAVWLWPQAAEPARASLASAAAWGSLWPVLLAALLAAAWGILRGAGWAVPYLPPGDLLVVAERGARALASVATNAARRIARGQAFAVERLSRLRRAWSLHGPLAAAEDAMGRWRLAGVLLLATALALYTLLAWQA